MGDIGLENETTIDLSSPLKIDNTVLYWTQLLLDQTSLSLITFTRIFK